MIHRSSFGMALPSRIVIFKLGIGREHGKNLADAEVPAFLPDTEEIRSDLLDYAFEIEWF